MSADRPFNLLWIGFGLGAVLLVAPKLLLRSNSGEPMFSIRDDDHILRMGRVCGVALMVIFGALVFASGSKGN